MFRIPGVTLLKQLRCTNKRHFVPSKEYCVFVNDNLSIFPFCCWNDITTVKFIIIRTLIVNLYCEFWNDKLDTFVFVGPSLDEWMSVSLVKFDKDLVVMGGSIYNSENFMYKLECENGQYRWQHMNVWLKKPRRYFVAAMIPTIYGNFY